MFINIDLKALIVLFTIINALIASSGYFERIIYGGVGKNGSSVAVSVESNKVIVTRNA